MMFLKNLLVSIAVLELVIAIDLPLQTGLDSLKVQYQRLADCQTNLCAKSYKVELSESVRSRSLDTFYLFISLSSSSILV